MVCKFCHTKVQLHKTNEKLFDYEAQRKETDHKHTEDMKVVQQLADAAEIEKIQLNSNVKDLQRKLEQTTVLPATELTKIKQQNKILNKENLKLKKLRENIK